MAPPTIICVTGMGRCGTSAVAGVLNLLGVSLGPADHLMGPAASNPKGHWEHEPLVRLNDEILASYGGCWDEPPSFPAGWHRSPAMADLRQRAREIVQADFDGVELWAWKDPRSSVTLPFWQDLLPPMKYIICLRNPLDVAYSLLRRDGSALEKSGEVWLTYTSSAIARTSGKPRLFLFYEDLMDDLAAQVERMAAFIERPGVAPDSLASIAEFIERELEHHRTPLAESLQETAIPFAAQALHLMLRGTVAAAAGQTDRAIDIFSRLSVEADTYLGASKDGVGELMEHLAQMASTVENQEQRLQALTAQLKDRLRENDQTLQSVSEKLQAVSHQLSEREKQVAGMERSLSWRWTRPLRQGKGWFRSIGRRK